jgi:hypothetical protein
MLEMMGTRAPTRCISSMLKATSASCASAKMCRKPLVEPPMAYLTTNQTWHALFWRESAHDGCGVFERLARHDVARASAALQHAEQKSDGFLAVLRGGVTMACEVGGCRQARLALLLADAMITARIDSRHRGGAAGTHAKGL